HHLPSASPLLPYTTLFRSLALRGDQRHAAERDQHAGPLREADALAERRGEQQDEDRRDGKVQDAARRRGVVQAEPLQREVRTAADRKSTRLNSSHQIISYA